MTDNKKKMTAQGSSVGADDGQSISTNSKFTIPDPDEKSNSPERDLEELYRKMRRMSDPAYLHTVTLPGQERQALLSGVLKNAAQSVERRVQPCGTALQSKGQSRCPGGQYGKAKGTGNAVLDKGGVSEIRRGHDGQAPFLLRL